MSLLKMWPLGLVGLLATSCIDSGQERTSFLLSANGSPIDGPIAARNDWQIELDTANLAFGPFYLCASRTADTLCDIAQAEWLDSVIIDALNAEPAALGEVLAIEGTIRSYMYDLGYSWPNDQSAPTATAAGANLGASVQLSGIAYRDDITIPFSALVSTASNTAGSVTFSSQSSYHTITSAEPGLLLTFDPSLWVDDVDFDVFLNEDGTFTAEEGVVFAEDTQPYRAVVSGLVAGDGPLFSWNGALAP